MLKVITFEAIPILIDGHDTQGQLVLADGELTAVLARLDGERHDPTSGAGGTWRPASDTA